MLSRLLFLLFFGLFHTPLSYAGSSNLPLVFGFENKAQVFENFEPIINFDLGPIEIRQYSPAEFVSTMNSFESKVRDLETHDLIRSIEVHWRDDKGVVNIKTPLSGKNLEEYLTDNGGCEEVDESCYDLLSKKNPRLFRDIDKPSKKSKLQELIRRSSTEYFGVISIPIKELEGYIRLKLDFPVQKIINLAEKHQEFCRTINAEDNSLLTELSDSTEVSSFINKGIFLLIGEDLRFKSLYGNEKREYKLWGNSFLPKEIVIKTDCASRTHSIQAVTSDQYKIIKKSNFH